MHQTLPNRIIAALRSLSNVNIKHVFVNSTDFSRTVKAHMESKTIKLRRIDRFPQFRAHNIQKRFLSCFSKTISRKSIKIFRTMKALSALLSSIALWQTILPYLLQPSVLRYRISYNPTGLRGAGRCGN